MKPYIHAKNSARLERLTAEVRDLRDALAARTDERDALRALLEQCHEYLDDGDRDAGEERALLRGIAAALPAGALDEPAAPTYPPADERTAAPLPPELLARAARHGLTRDGDHWWVRGALSCALVWLCPVREAWCWEPESASLHAPEPPRCATEAEALTSACDWIEAGEPAEVSRG